MINLPGFVCLLNDVLIVAESRSWTCGYETLAIVESYETGLNTDVPCFNFGGTDITNTHYGPRKFVFLEDLKTMVDYTSHCASGSKN